MHAHVNEHCFPQLVAYWADTHHKGEPISRVWNYYAPLRRIALPEKIIEGWCVQHWSWRKRMLCADPKALKVLEEEIQKIAA